MTSYVNKILPKVLGGNQIITNSNANGIYEETYNAQGELIRLEQYGLSNTNRLDTASIVLAVAMPDTNYNVKIIPFIARDYTQGYYNKSTTRFNIRWRWPIGGNALGFAPCHWHALWIKV